MVVTLLKIGDIHRLLALVGLKRANSGSCPDWRDGRTLRPLEALGVHK